MMTGGEVDYRVFTYGAESLMKRAFSGTHSISTGVQILLCKYPFTN